ncbi:hypothetical protein X777_11599 [Ooceraea biroi]|uniref:Uncharacterized protein n=1 Tax=Ooceraea biroi TaxID=2015173 RepID=A0A026W0Y4_OOCBI|nr:hypothetical protein X777_11599 [Ooceraea biroi]
MRRSDKGLHGRRGRRWFHPLRPLLEEDDGAVVNSEGVIKTMIIHPFLRRLCERATATDDD